ncbi:MAG: ABC transporter permease [Deltaproteobacteria bacterium]|nr:ABC transporter permease [Deltaproteobacteria bacterium]
MPLPHWLEIFVVPLVNLALALLVVALVFVAIGEDPFRALAVMAQGAFVYPGSLGYTLYYTTNFIFTGLAVAVAFHAMLFNIGGEGQATFGGLGVALICLALDPFLPGVLVILLAIGGAAAFGAAWAFIPGWLQAHRGSHIVITTIMFNFIAAGLLVWLLSGMLMMSGQGSPQTKSFDEATWLPFVHDILRAAGLEVERSPFNLSFFIALAACVGVWLLIWRTKFGYALRTMGHSEPAAVYAGIPVQRITVLAMAISGALAGCMALNEILGAQHRLVLNFSAGYGFTGIAVALMGRNHPVGIVMAALLFGALYQGGAELDFEFRSVTSEMVLVIQGLIILFSGALAHMPVPWLVRLIAWWRPANA